MQTSTKSPQILRNNAVAFNVFLAMICTFFFVGHLFVFYYSTNTRKFNKQFVNTGFQINVRIAPAILLGLEKFLKCGNILKKQLREDIS